MGLNSSKSYFFISSLVTSGTSPNLILFTARYNFLVIRLIRLACGDCCLVTKSPTVLQPNIKINNFGLLTSDLIRVRVNQGKFIPLLSLDGGTYWNFHWMLIETPYSRSKFHLSYPNSGCFLKPHYHEKRRSKENPGRNR